VASTLWVAHVHAIEAAPMAAYLRVKSVAEESGKTTLLEVLHQLLGGRGINATSVSPAVVYRLRDKVGPVALLLDESDKTMARRQDDNAQDLVAIVNSGYRRSATVYRTEGRSFEPRAFKAFGPAAIAGIGHLEPTTESRCIPVVLTRKPRGSLERFISFRVEPDANEILNRFRAWAAPEVIDHLRDQTPAYPPELRDRHVEAWWNMLTIADLAGGEWPLAARAAALALHVDGDNEATFSTGVLLLAHLKTVFEESQVDRMPSADLIRALVANESGPWAKWWSAEANREGSPRAAATDLARKLRGFERPDGEPIAPHVIKMRDGTTPRGYHAEDFETAWSTYLPSFGSPPRNHRNHRNRAGQHGCAPTPQQTQPPQPPWPARLRWLHPPIQQAQPP